MNRRRLQVAGLLGLAATALLCLLLARCHAVPFRLKVVSVEPSSVVNDRGEEYALVGLQLQSLQPMTQVGASRHSNHGFLTIEARVAGTWVDTDSRCSPGYPSPRQSHQEMQLLVPPGADACRIVLSYRTEKLKWRLFRRFAPQLGKLPPKLVQRIWPNGMQDTLGSPQAATLQVPLPKPAAAL